MRGFAATYGRCGFSAQPVAAGCALPYEDADYTDNGDEEGIACDGICHCAALLPCCQTRDHPAYGANIYIIRAHYAFDLPPIT